MYVDIGLSERICLLNRYSKCSISFLDDGDDDDDGDGEDSNDSDDEGGGDDAGDDEGAGDNDDDGGRDRHTLGLVKFGNK